MENRLWRKDMVMAGLDGNAPSAPLLKRSVLANAALHKVIHASVVSCLDVHGTY